MLINYSGIQQLLTCWMLSQVLWALSDMQMTEVSLPVNSSASRGTASFDTDPVQVEAEIMYYS